MKENNRTFCHSFKYKSLDNCANVILIQKAKVNNAFGKQKDAVLPAEQF